MLLFPFYLFSSHSVLLSFHQSLCGSVRLISAEYFPNTTVCLDQKYERVTEIKTCLLVVAFRLKCDFLLCSIHLSTIAAQDTRRGL